MPLPVLPAAPTVPARSQPPATFNSNVANFLAWMGTFSGALPDWADELIQAAADANYNSASATSHTIGTGSKVFTIETNMLFEVGQFVIIASAANPSNWMYGQVTAHNSSTGSLTVNVTRTNGSGTRTDWLIALSGIPAVDGTSPTLNYASQAEAEGGSATGVIMNPLRTLQAMQALGGWSLTTSGTGGNPASVQFSFATPYKEGVLRCENISHNNGSNASIQVQLGVSGVYTTIHTTTAFAAAASRSIGAQIHDFGAGQVLVQAFDDDSASPGTPNRTDRVYNLGGAITTLRILATAGNLDQGGLYFMKRW